MKITGVSPVVVNAEMRNWVFVKLSTDEGLTGWGEATLEWHTRAVAGALQDLEPFILGQDPTRIEHLYQAMYRHPFFRGGIVGMSAVSGIEMACWDVLGKSLGLPVYRLLGGRVRDRVRMYDHLGGGDMRSLYLEDDVGRIAERARESVELGYTALKVLAVPVSEPLPTSKELRRADEVFAAVREAVGDGVDLMVDLHGRTTPEGGVLFGKVLEPYRPLFLEEPCPPDNVEGLLHVSRSLSTPVASGERLVTRYEFRELVERRACAVVQPDLCHCGGLWEARKIAAAAETHHISIAPHNPLGPVATAANVHFGLSTPNFLIQEAIRGDVPWRGEVVTSCIEVRDGHACPPDQPGLGVEVNEEEAARHPFRQEVLMAYHHRDGSVADW